MKSVSEIQQNSIGHCEEFKVVDVIRRPSMVEGRTKRSMLPPLMVFEGCRHPRVCTVVLYGDSTQQMEAVAKVVDSAVFAAYHLRLESAFLADELSVASTAMAAVAKGETPPSTPPVLSLLYSHCAVAVLPQGADRCNRSFGSGGLM